MVLFFHYLPIAVADEVVVVAEVVAERRCVLASSDF